jgi:alanyl-tRNA synthetase
MTSSEIRQSFLDFFREKQHTIVPSSSLLPDAPNLLFTNAGMNQFVPIFLGQTPCPYSPARAADTQKCIRAGGKHNDLEDVGFDTYHHTFFEMLGNWSFGDYFKKEAIAWAWELVVNRWGFPPSRVYATIYSPGPGDPASLDREAHEHWSEIFIQNKLDPAYHVVHGNKKDNFWMMGDTGPCGPCSELHIDLTPGPRDLDIPRQIAGRNLVNKGDARCIEIWNLVFIQFNANPDGTFTDLPAKHVDTGMGFERVTSMIQGTKGFTDFENAKISNYETDVFRPLFDELEKITGKTYKSTLPTSAQNLTEDEKVDVAFRVIADHIRTLSFSIADGISPGHGDRGAVVKSILRRAVRYGYQFLGMETPFLARLVPTLQSTMGDVFPELVTKSEIIKATLTQDEESFFRTIERGIATSESIMRAKRLIAGVAAPIAAIPEEDEARASQVIYDCFRGSASLPGDRDLLLKSLSPSEWKFFTEGQKLSASNPGTYWVMSKEQINDFKGLAEMSASYANTISGSAAFLLHDTYGFPVDLTALMARERGLSVDKSGFEFLMEQQKARGRAAQKKERIEVLIGTGDSTEKTDFVGYEQSETKATFTGTSTELMVADQAHSVVYFDKTVFYAEMGGQVGDTGTVEVFDTICRVTDTQKSKTLPVVLHFLDRPLPGVLGNTVVTLHVDEPRRAKIEAHHSVTHIMHWALRKVLGTTVSQKGSYVGPDRLRFDFSHGTAMTPDEIAEVEKLVNEKIEADLPVTWDERPYAQVKGDPSILQFFGDKYGEMVRVVSIGDFSKELCGGTHVRHSGKIGYFKILHESAIAAGIRRIEAMSGEALRLNLKELLKKQDEVLEGRAAARPPISETAGERTGGSPSLQEMWALYQAREKQLQDLELARIQSEKDTAKKQESEFQKRAAIEAPALIDAAMEINGVPFLAKHVDAPAAYLPLLADALKARWQGVAVLAADDGAKVALLAAVAPAFTKKVQAGKIIQAIAPLVGGKGGGRPELAQGGGTNPAGIAEALAKAESLL